MHLRHSQAAGAVMTREGAEVLCSAHPLQRDHSTLSSAKGAVEDLPGSAGPPRAGRICAAGLAQILSCTNLVLHKSSSTPKADTAMGCSETNLGQASTKAQSLLWQGPHTLCGHVLSLCEIPRDLTAVQILTRGPCKLATVRLEAQNHRESCPTR